MFKILAVACFVSAGCGSSESLPIFPSMKACEKFTDSWEWHDVVNAEFFNVDRATRAALGSLARTWAVCVPEKKSLH